MKNLYLNYFLLLKFACFYVLMHAAASKKHHYLLLFYNISLNLIVALFAILGVDL